MLMSRHDVWMLAMLVASTLLWQSPSLCAGDRKSQRLPNIIFILADDLGYGEVGCYGQQKIKTPNLDRLAARGMRFTQHYAGNAVCAPSRCTLMTGKHPGHALVRTNLSTPPEGQHPLPTGTQTLARLLRALRYVTGAFGKWGLGGPGSTGAPGKQGIDQFFGYLCQGKAHNSYPPSLWHNEREVPLKNPAITIGAKLGPGADPKDPASYKAFQGQEYAPDLIAEQARKFIRDNKDRPFFLFVPTTVPHLALQVEKRNELPVDHLRREYSLALIFKNHRIASFLDTRANRDTSSRVYNPTPRTLSVATTISISLSDDPTRRSNRPPKITHPYQIYCRTDERTTQSCCR